MRPDVAMEVRETGLQAKLGFACQTSPAGGAGLAGQAGLCWPNQVLLAKLDYRPSRVSQLQAKQSLQAKRDCGPNRVLQAKPGLQTKRDCAPIRVLLTKPGLAGTQKQVDRVLFFWGL